MKKPRDLIDDFNGKFARLEEKFPKVAKGLMKDCLLDRFFGGINSVGRLNVNGNEFLFIETPGHGWIVNMSGKVVGEEDCGFRNKKLNENIKEVFNAMERLF